MAEIKPFRGVLYNASGIGDDCSSVMAPPYDVISESQQDELYEKNAHNVIKLILGKSFTDDNASENKYIRSRRFLDEWQKSGVLLRDDKESFYLYHQEYDHKGKRLTRTGFIGLMKVGDSSNDLVLPHERTHAKPKEDRLNLIKQVEANLSPIFTLYEDTGCKIKKYLMNGISASDVVFDFDMDGIQHRLWRLSDEGSIEGMISGMSGKKIFIADGHHRYEVAKTYRDLCRKESCYDGAADYVMMFFADMSSCDNLTVLATHRVIKDIPDFNEDETARKLGEYFDLLEFDSLIKMMNKLEEESSRGHVFGFFGGKKYIFLKPRDEKEILTLIPDDRTDDWKQLDVSVLHSAIFDKILSINRAEGNIAYARYPEKAETLVREGSYAAAFFMNPTRIDQLKAVAEHGEMMPQKSTYFYPKLLTGLVINLFEKSEVSTEEKNRR